jgi:flagellar assembly protein FliH
MPTVIKSTDRNRGIQRVAFNFDDMAAKADEYLGGIRAEAARILTDAHKEARAIRKKAEAEARDAGYKAGRNEVEQMVEKKLLATLLPAISSAMKEIQLAKQSWLAHWEKTAVGLACAIASRLIRRELSATPEITLSLIRETLELAAGSSHLRIHLNSDDHQTLGRQVRTLTRELAGLAATEIVSDPEISPGGCRVETSLGIIDQQFEAQLARIEEELT